MSFISQTAGRSRPLHNLPRTADIAISRAPTSGGGPKGHERGGQGPDTVLTERRTPQTEGRTEGRTLRTYTDRGTDTADIYGQSRGTDTEQQEDSGSGSDLGKTD